MIDRKKSFSPIRPILGAGLLWLLLAAAAMAQLAPQQDTTSVEDRRAISAMLSQFRMARRDPPKRNEIVEAAWELLGDNFADATYTPVDVALEEGGV